MSKMLINAYQLNSNQIRHIYSEDGIVKKETINFKPFLGFHAKKDEKTKWSDMYGKPVKVKVFDSIVDMHKWKKENKNVLKIFGDIDVVDMFVATRYQKEIELDKTGLKIFNIDIECVSIDGSGGFPNVIDTKNPITSITVNDMGLEKYYIFAYVPYITQNENEVFIKCENEIDLIHKFLNFWNEEDPQIITGWSIETFDIPYLVNRINKICGPETVKKLSIDRVIKKSNETDTTGKETIYYSLQGHIIWDYIKLYKKYTQENRESYSLDSIAEVELGSNKIKFQDDYDNLNDLYANDPQKFLMYNKMDTQLVYDIDYVKDYINVALSIMHKAKCRPDKIFGTLAPWDCIIYNELLARKILCPPNVSGIRADFIGGYVTEDFTPGLYDWTMVYDIVSSYPNTIISYNMSMETIIHDDNLPDELKRVKEKFTDINICADLNQTKELGDILRKYDVCFTSNGYFFDISKEGIIPSIFSKLFKLRQDYKKQLKEYKKEGKDREAKIADLYQYTIKILLNSGFGALSNMYGRYFDMRIGEAITSGGQVSVKGVSKHIIEKNPIVNIYYNDTDSCFINMKELLDQRYKGKEVSDKDKLEFILKYSKQFIDPVVKDFFNQLKTNMNLRQLTLAMEPEVVANLSLFTAKRRYIMNKVWDEGVYLIDNPKRKIRGVEIIRSSTPKICREKLKEAVELIFSTRSNDTLIDFIEVFREEFKTLPIEVISSTTSVTFNSYTRDSSGLPIGVCASFSYNDYLKKLQLDKKYVSIADGDKIKFCYIKKGNDIGSHVIGFLNKLPVEMKNGFKVDYELQFQKVFLAPLNNIFKAINWNIKKINTLEDFFD